MMDLSFWVRNKGLTRFDGCLTSQAGHLEPWVGSWLPIACWHGDGAVTPRFSWEMRR